MELEAERMVQRAFNIENDWKEEHHIRVLVEAVEQAEMDMLQTEYCCMSR